MKIKIAIVFFLLIYQLQCQTDEGVYTSKYWNYRYALRGDEIDPSARLFEPGFLRVGAGSGYSLPMRNRVRIIASGQHAGAPFNNWLIGDDVPVYRRMFTNNPFNTSFGQRDGIVTWGDGSGIDLGRYYILLATELELLMKDADRYSANTLSTLESQNYNLAQQLKMTYHELSMAVNAMDRLDFNSDIRWGGTPHGGDGFFVRDDVPDDFADDGKFGRAQFLTNNYWTNGNWSDPYYKGHSFFNARSPHISAGQKGPCVADLAPSKDQFVKVMLGVVYAKTFMHNFKNKFGDPDNLEGRCHDIIDRSIWRTFQNYSISDPHGNAVCKGSDMVAFSPILWDVYNWYGYGGYNFGADIYQLSIGNLTLFGYKYFLTNVYPSIQILNTGFPGNAWSHEIFNYACMQGDRSPMYIFPNSLKLFGDNLGQHNEKELHYQFNFLAEAVRNRLHGGGTSVNFSTSSIPSINFRWMGLSQYEGFMNRWNFDCEHETRLWYRSDESSVEEMNGIDYMIAYNLYMLEKDRHDRVDMANNRLSSYIPMYDRFIEGNFPRAITYNFNSTPNTWPPIVNTGTASIMYGNTANPVVIEAANSIKTNGAVIFASGSRGTIRAPHVEILPGFAALPGSVVLFDTPQRMHCTPYATLASSAGTLHGKMVEARMESPIARDITLYPNPTKSNATLKFKNYNNSQVRINIYNIVGVQVMPERKEEIFNNESEREIQISTEDLGAGIYIIKISYGEDFKSLKLQKE